VAKQKKYSSKGIVSWLATERPRKKLLVTLSQELTRDYGNGFSYSALTRMA